MVPTLTVIADNGRLANEHGFSCTYVEPVPRYPGYHTHRAFLELVLVFRGPVRHCINGHREILERGTLMLVRERDFHYYERALGSVGGFVNLAMLPAHVSQTAEFLGCPEALRRLLEMRLPPRVVLESEQADSVLHELSELNFFTESANSLVGFRSLLAMLLRWLLPATTSSGSGAFPEWFHSLLRSCERKPVFTRDTRQLCGLAGRSPEHLARTFRRYLGVTPSRYLNERRLRYAADLLHLTDIPVREVAVEAGFVNMSHFHRLFRGKYGQTPNAFRREFDHAHFLHLPEWVRAEARRMPDSQLLSEDGAWIPTDDDDGATGNYA